MEPEKGPSCGKKEKEVYKTHRLAAEKTNPYDNCLGFLGILILA